jgi:hypothetical protein
MTVSGPGDPHSEWEGICSYLVRAEPVPLSRRKAAFETLSSARYFARTWAFKSQVPILVVDGRSGEPMERYSSRFTPK